ncbi:ATPase [Methylosoma difficile]
MKKPIIIASSGGKDATLALHRLRHHPDYCETYQPVGLMTTFCAQSQRSNAHQIRLEVMEVHAASLGLAFYPLFMQQPSDHGFYDYPAVVGAFYDSMVAQGISHFLYGDIHLEDVKTYRDQLNQQHGITGVYPLWREHPAGLIHEFLNLGFKAKVVAVDSSRLGVDCLGKTLDTAFLQALPLHVDACAENGEFHTLCYDGPDFAFPLAIADGEQSQQGHYHYLDVALTCALP